MSEIKVQNNNNNKIWIALPSPVRSSGMKIILEPDNFWGPKFWDTKVFKILQMSLQANGLILIQITSKFIWVFCGVHTQSVMIFITWCRVIYRGLPALIVENKINRKLTLKTKKIINSILIVVIKLTKKPGICVALWAESSCELQFCLNQDTFKPNHVKTVPILGKS